jgi:dihydroflavonol-4-reductase
VTSDKQKTFSLVTCHSSLVTVFMTTKTKKSPRKTSTKSRPKKTTAIVRQPSSKTLVTGGTGFLGAHLVHQLLETGAKNLRVMATQIPAWLAELGVETFAGSITEAEDVARAVEGVGEIYHLAGRVSRELEDAHEMYSIHVDGTRILCDAAQAANVKTIVLASTSGTIAVRERGDGIPDETGAQPLDIISRWPYYASKLYQERTALERFSGTGRRLVILNPSLLLGPGDERLSSTKVVLDFLARKINAIPTGGLSFVDVRDAASAFRAAMKDGRHGERYLLGSANWTFDKFFNRLERLTKVRAPRFSFPSKVAIAGSQIIHAFYKQWDKAPPVEPAAVEMAEYFWYLDSSKAESELGFSPRDPGETLLNTVQYLRENFLAGV